VSAILQAFLPQLALIIFLAILPKLLLFLTKKEGVASIAHAQRGTAGKVWSVHPICATWQHLLPYISYIFYIFYIPVRSGSVLLAYFCVKLLLMRPKLLSISRTVSDLKSADEVRCPLQVKKIPSISEAWVSVSS
jgi:hypothetical protein